MPVLRFANPYICEGCWRRISRLPSAPGRQLAARHIHASASATKPNGIEPTTLELTNGQSKSGPLAERQREGVLSRNTQNFEPTYSSEERPVAAREYTQDRGINGHPRHDQGRWRVSHLQEKSLGERASVLTVHEPERKRDGKRLPGDAPKEPSVDAEPLQVFDILQSLKDQSVDPEQSEVNAVIDSLRPGLTPFAETAIATDAHQESLIEELRKKFTEVQLARYITSKRGAEMEFPVMLAESASVKPSKTPMAKAKALEEKGVFISPWFMAEPVHAEPHAKAARTKRGRLATKIVKSIWKLQKSAEALQIGVIQVFVRQDVLSGAGLGADGMALQDIARIRNVKIELDRTRNIITITANKLLAQESAQDVAKLFQIAHEMLVDIGTLRSHDNEPRSALWNTATIQDMATAAGCVTEWVKPMEKLKVRAVKLDAIESFHRMLLRSVHSHERVKETYVSTADSKQDGFVVAGPSVGLDISHFQHNQLGRFTMAFDLAGGLVSIPKVVPFPSISQLKNKMEQALQQDSLFGTSLKEGSRRRKIIEPKTVKLPGWKLSSKLGFSASFGHILHPFPNKEIVHKTKLESLLQSDQRLLLSHSIGGLPYLLEQDHFDLLATVSHSLRIQFLPSPYSMPAPEPKPDVKMAVPSMEMVLRYNQKTRGFVTQELTLILGSQRVGILQPKSGLDAVLARNETITYANPEGDRQVANFVDTLNSFCDVPGRPERVPPALTMSIPTCTFFPISEKQHPWILSGSPLYLMEYLTMSYQQETDLIFRRGDRHEIVYRQVHTDDQGRGWESVALNTIELPDTEYNPFANTTSKTETKAAQTVALNGRIEEFVAEFLPVFRRLSIGLGRTREMGTERKRRAAEAKRAAVEEAARKELEGGITNGETGHWEGLESTKPRAEW